MVSELISLAILKFIRGRNPSLRVKIGETERVSEENDSASPSEIFRHLLGQFELTEIDSAIRWLDYCNYLGESSATIRGPFWWFLTDKGRLAADANAIADEDKVLLYQEEDPYGVFIAHQFSQDDADLVAYVKGRVLEPSGFRCLEGHADGLEEFRHAILSKIRRARFFVCLMTKRMELASGGFASSVWLYQETGVAVAYGKKPLLLVEDGIEPQFVGEPQGVYEYISFTRSNHPQKFESITRRITADLGANKIPFPVRLLERDSLA